MSAPAFNLDIIDVASPCPVSWESMAGTDRVRFCSQCRLHVYNLSELDRAAAETLVQTHEGRLCARFYRRADGRVLTRDCADIRSDRVLTRRLAAVFGLFIGALVSLLGFVSAAEGDRGPARGLRRFEPFRTILNWIDPQPAPLMACICLPPPPPTGPEVAPPPRPVGEAPASEG
jgi:hypothetical protein